MDARKRHHTGCRRRHRLRHRAGHPRLRRHRARPNRVRVHTRRGNRTDRSRRHEARLHDRTDAHKPRLRGRRTDLCVVCWRKKHHCHLPLREGNSSRGMVLREGFAKGTYRRTLRRRHQQEASQRPEGAHTLPLPDPGTLRTAPGKLHCWPTAQRHTARRHRRVCRTD